MITQKQIGDSIFVAQMSHPRAVFDSMDVLAKRQGISHELAEQLISLYREMIDSAVRIQQQREQWHARRLLDGARVTLRNRLACGGETTGVCRPEPRGDPNDLATLWLYPVFSDDGSLLFWIEPHGPGFALTDNDHFPVEVTIPARRC